MQARGQGLLRDLSEVAFYLGTDPVIGIAEAFPNAKGANAFPFGLREIEFVQLGFYREGQFTQQEELKEQLLRSTDFSLPVFNVRNGKFIQANSLAQLRLGEPFFFAPFF